MLGNSCTFTIGIFMNDKDEFIWYSYKIKNLCEAQTLWRFSADNPPAIYNAYTYSVELPVFYPNGYYINFSGEIDECITFYEAMHFIEEFERCGIHLSCVDKVEIFFHEPCMNVLGLYKYEKGSLYEIIVPPEKIPNEDDVGDAIYDPDYYSNLIRDYGVMREVKEFHNGVFCKRCHSKVWKSDVAGYSYTCYVCDEDLYDIETYKKKSM